MNIISWPTIELRMNGPVTIVLVGIGGMGSIYLESLLERWESREFRIAGAVDPQPQRCPYLDQLQQLGIPIFQKLEDFYAQDRAQLVIISSPIHFHAMQTRLALAQGSHVLCEKPVAATIQEARETLASEKASGKHVAVGYQWSFSAAIQRLKKDIQRGLLGRPRRLKCLYLWPRGEAYYRRNNWAGRKRDAEGRWILDSPANNAMAHDLHNMFYILGLTRETSTRPVRVEAELYRAYDIENFDTAALRCFVEEGAEILFYVSHACQADTGPVFQYEFENGMVEARGRNADIKAVLTKGEVINYGNPDCEPLRKMWEAMDMVRNGELPACGIEGAMSQTLCLNGAQDSMPEINNFPRSLLHMREEANQMFIAVEGIEEALGEAYEKSLLPSEIGVAWSKKGKVIDLTRYQNFPGG